MRHTLRRTCVLPALLVTLFIAHLGALPNFTPPAQAQGQPETQPQAQAQPGIHPGVQLGRRAAIALAARRVIPTVVLVSDPADYAQAIASWTPESIFPVLIDDGSRETREHIARFVRGFRAESVVRWADGPGGPRPGAPMRPRVAVPNARELAENALAAAWDFRDQPLSPNEFLARLTDLGRTPPGVVIADPSDTAWTAALALAAAHGQPILWTQLPATNINQSLDRAKTDELCAQIESRVDALGLSWNTTGDAIDAITLCASLPARVQTAPEEHAAMSDRLGRDRTGNRWAWTGQIFGTEPHAAYRAMCAVFIQPTSAWIFDGYAGGEPWDRWDGAPAAETLKQTGGTVMLDDLPRNKISDWRLRAERPVHAGLVLLNSSGNRNWFDLSGTRAQAGDIPLLEVPSAVHMVHSWSAVNPARETTVAGRWIDRGAFAYIGSVHEPYLQAFVPTPMVAQRLIAGMAWGATGRRDQSPLWRIAVFGDPLYVARPTAPRAEDPLPLEGVKPLEDEIKAAAGEERFADLYASLALAGRDRDVVRLFDAMLDDQPELLDADTAHAALFPLFRTGLDDAFLRAYAALDQDTSSGLHEVDALWHLGRRAARERTTYADAAVALMARHARQSQADADAAELRSLQRGP